MNRHHSAPVLSVRRATGTGHRCSTPSIGSMLSIGSIGSTLSIGAVGVYGCIGTRQVLPRKEIPGPRTA